jgi:hypothetical protein
MIPTVGKLFRGRRREQGVESEIFFKVNESIMETTHERRRLSSRFTPSPDLHRGGEVE